MREARGADARQESLFTVAKLDDYVPLDDPLRTVQVSRSEQARLRIISQNPLGIRPSCSGDAR